MPHRILAIDDSMAIRTFIARTLEQDVSGIEILTAKDGAQGLQVAQTSAPELILLDFILPDMKGDAVCERLLNNPVTASIPVVLMSSNATDIKRSEAAYRNVVKSIAKPFTPELLTAIVHHVMRERRDEPQATGKGKTAAGLLFTGYSPAFPLQRAFLAAEEEALTGVLRIHSSPEAIECYVRDGRLELVTTRDASTYASLKDLSFAAEQVELVAKAKKEQHASGSPFYMGLARDGVIDLRQVPGLCRETGNRLLSAVWTAGRVRYEFESLSELPDYVPDTAVEEICMDERLLESIRLVKTENLKNSLAWDDVDGTPIYTRDGYERVQRIGLNEEEAEFLGKVGDSTVSEVASRLGCPVERVKELLFRFLCLRIFEYWPSALLRSSQSEASELSIDASNEKVYVSANI